MNRTSLLPRREALTAEDSCIPVKYSIGAMAAPVNDTASIRRKFEPLGTSFGLYGRSISPEMRTAKPEAAIGLALFTKSLVITGTVPPSSAQQSARLYPLVVSFETGHFRSAIFPWTT